MFLERHGATVAKRSRRHARGAAEACAREQFGDWTLRELEDAAADVAAWRATLLDGSRYQLTSALRQSLGAAVRWRYIGRNPAVDAGRNPQPRTEELLPFTPDEIDALEVELGPAFGPAGRVRRRDRPANERVDGPRAPRR